MGKQRLIFFCKGYIWELQSISLAMRLFFLFFCHNLRSCLSSSSSSSSSLGFYYYYYSTFGDYGTNRTSFEAGFFVWGWGFGVLNLGWGWGLEGGGMGGGEEDGGKG